MFKLGFESKPGRSAARKVYEFVMYGAFPSASIELFYDNLSVSYVFGGREVKISEFFGNFSTVGRIDGGYYSNSDIKS